jgi:hypothetical protein
MKDVTKQLLAFGKIFKYRIAELRTEFHLPSGETMTCPNWDVKGVRERFFREEYLDPEVHYNQPKESEPSEFGIKASDVRRFVEDNIDIFDPLPPMKLGFEPIQVAGEAPKVAGKFALSEAHSA